MSWPQQFLLAFLYAVHAGVMLADEFYFHRKRGLSRWERVGHPLDTLTVLVCFAAPLAIPFARPGLIAVGTLSIFSCLFVTKDEWIHHPHCEAAEHWLHALLFIMHPVILASSVWLWYFEARGVGVAHALRFFFLAALGGFGSYQTVYWNLPPYPRTDRDATAPRN